MTVKRKFHLARHVSTRSTCRVHAFTCVELVEQHGWTWRARLAPQYGCGLHTQLSLLYNLYKVMICKLFTNLLEYRFILFILFDGTNRICVCKSIKTTKLVQACSSSAMLEQHGLTRSSRLARHVKRVETWRDEPSGIWAYTTGPYVIGW